MSSRERSASGFPDVHPFSVPKGATSVVQQHALVGAQREQGRGRLVAAIQLRREHHTHSGCVFRKCNLPLRCAEVERDDAVLIPGAAPIDERLIVNGKDA